MTTIASTIGVAITPAPAAAAPIALDPGGDWGPVEDWPMVGIHSALDSNGRVVTYGTNPDGTQTGQFIYDIWTPNPSAAAGHNTLANTTQTDLFCSLQLNRVDTGDMILFGGDNWTGAGTNNRGNADINQINAETGALAPLPGMNRARWYATGTTLPDGSIYVQGGLDGGDRAEHWTPGGGARLLDFDTSGLYYYYPRNFLAPDGRVFGISGDGWLYWVNQQLTDLQIVGRLPAHQRGVETTAVMYEPGKILYFGGATTEVITIDITSGNPVINRTADLSGVRHWVNGTVLPDGRVLATGGSVKNSTIYYYDPIETYGSNLTAEIWDPRTGQWTVGDSAQVPRLYHSTALLLPDGRVLSAGGGAPGPITNTDAEIYSPDYLRTATGQPTPRLEIQGLSSTDVAAGQVLNIAVSSGADVNRVTMVKTGSVTHSWNMEQRFVELGFNVNGNTVSAGLPVNQNEITPGYYLLSVLDENDIPSVSQIIRVLPPAMADMMTQAEGEVFRLYRAYFLRNPDQAGADYWVGQRLAGVSLVTISDAFAASPEFVARYGNLTDAQFIDQLYRNVMEREADAGGRAHWLEQMAAGLTRGEVMVSFSESAEFRAKTALDGPAAPDTPLPPPPAPPAPPAPTPVAGFEPEIKRLYLGYFLRAADEGGLAHWTTLRANGLSLVEVSEEFATSAEFVARYGQADDATFVDLVYQNVLGRAPDAGGRAHWIDQLAAGMTRGEMMIGFTESPEFINATAGQI